MSQNERKVHEASQAIKTGEVPSKIRIPASIKDVSVSGSVGWMASSKF